MVYWFKAIARYVDRFSATPSVLRPCPLDGDSPGCDLDHPLQEFVKHVLAHCRVQAGCVLPEAVVPPQGALPLTIGNGGKVSIVAEMRQLQLGHPREGLPSCRFGGSSELPIHREVRHRPTDHNGSSCHCVPNFELGGVWQG
jgi:hypothetical protein